ncbi:MAG: preprotein translocase subunit SecE [Lachnospiraceae bacterium]|nr:preprotein translocase subunit SecE [Lachnospiraceae bacterium]
MSENSKKVNSVEKKGGFKALKNEFNKIMWPDRATVVNKSIAVVITTTVLALVIAGLDYVINLAMTTFLG